MLTKVILHSNLCKKYLCTRTLQLAKHKLATTNTPTDAPQLSYTPVTFPVARYKHHIFTFFYVVTVHQSHSKHVYSVAVCHISYTVCIRKSKFKLHRPWKSQFSRPAVFFILSLCGWCRCWQILYSYPKLDTFCPAILIRFCTIVWSFSMTEVWKEDNPSETFQESKEK